MIQTGVDLMNDEGSVLDTKDGVIEKSTKK